MRQSTFKLQAPDPPRYRRGAAPQEGFGAWPGQGHLAASRNLRGTRHALSHRH